MFIGKRIIDAVVAIAGKLGATVGEPSGNKLADYMEAIAEKAGGSGLPDVGTSDNGKVAKVIEGEWGVGYDEGGLPEVTTSDNGKIMKVVEGDWQVADAPSGLPTTTSGDWNEGMWYGCYTSEDQEPKWYARRWPLYLGCVVGDWKTDEDDEDALRVLNPNPASWGGYSGVKQVFVSMGNNQAGRINATLLPPADDGTEFGIDTRGKTIRGNSEYGDWELVEFPEGLPASGSGVGSSEPDTRNKILKGNSTTGDWEIADLPAGMPTVTSGDVGAISYVNASGQWIKSIGTGAGKPTSLNEISSRTVLGWDGGSNPAWRPYYSVLLPQYAGTNKILGTNQYGGWAIVDAPVSLPGFGSGAGTNEPDTRNKIIKGNSTTGAWEVTAYSYPEPWLGMETDASYGVTGPMQGMYFFDDGDWDDDTDEWVPDHKWVTRQFPVYLGHCYNDYSTSDEYDAIKTTEIQSYSDYILSDGFLKVLAQFPGGGDQTEWHRVGIGVLPVGGNGSYGTGDTRNKTIKGGAQWGNWELVDFPQGLPNSGSGAGASEPDTRNKILKGNATTGAWEVGDMPASIPATTSGDWNEGLCYYNNEMEGENQWKVRRYPIFLGDVAAPYNTDEDDADAREYFCPTANNFDTFDGYSVYIEKPSCGIGIAQRAICALLPSGGDGTEPGHPDTRGKTLKGHDTDGTWKLVDFPEGLPAYTTADEGKVLKIVSGVPTWVTP